MRHLSFVSVSLLTIIGVVGLVATPPVAGQSSSGPKTFHTPWGDPDLQGTWTASGATPMERPDKYQGSETLRDEQLAQEVAQLARQAEERDERGPRPGNPGTYNSFWIDRGQRTNRTSMVVDPPDGRFPPLTPAGQDAKSFRLKAGKADSWEDRHIWERCVTRGGMPNAMFPRGYNNNALILQIPGYVAILLEEIHETRIIPLDDRPLLRRNIRQWMGDSRGHWDGDSLVVVTSNHDHRVSALQPWSNFDSRSGSGEALTLVERFTRSDADTLEYEIRVDDPQMYTRPWTVAYPFERTTNLLYEYECHEGNRGMVGILSGGRADEAATAGVRRQTEVGR